MIKKKCRPHLLQEVGFLLSISNKCCSSFHGMQALLQLSCLGHSLLQLGMRFL